MLLGKHELKRFFMNELYNADDKEGEITKFFDEHGMLEQATLALQNNEFDQPLRELDFNGFCEVVEKF